MKKILPALFAEVLCITGLYSCKCSGSRQCPAFSSVNWEWLYPQQQDTIVYRNDNGQELYFIKKEVNTSSAYTAFPTSNGIFGGCTQDDCTANGSLWFTDTSGLWLTYRLEFTNETLAAVYYGAGNFFDKLPLPYQPEASEDNGYQRSVSYNLQLGSRSYEQVMVITRTSTVPVIDIRKVYFAEHYGIVGFENSDSSLYYLR